MDSREVLSFWFGDSGALQVRDEWFRKSEEFDDSVRSRFADAIERALANELDAWTATAGGTLALILVLDQFTRNAFRDTARAFAGDALALAHARRLVYRGRDRDLKPIQRWFVYMPFEHSECLVDQYEAVRLFRALADDGLREPLDWAFKHLDVVRRFGRFPHRNSVLGRVSTPAEIEFLKTPGSRF
jgi:uncharacterized protein (DUF924 family)